MATNIPVYNPQGFSEKFLSFLASNNNDTDFNNFFISKFDKGFQELVCPTPHHRKTVNDLILVTNGYFERSINLKNYKVGKGEIFFYRQNQINSTNFISDDFEGIYVHFSNSYFSIPDFELDFITPLIIISQTDFSFSHTLLSRLLLIKDKLDKQLLIQLHIQLLIKYILEWQTDQNEIEHSIQFEYLKKFKLLLQENVRLHRKPHYYASQLNITTNHLNKITKLYEKLTSSELIQQYLILEAKVLLNQTTLNIGNIAEALGFDDSLYFSKFFHKNVGVSPLKYRKGLKST